MFLIGSVSFVQVFLTFFLAFFLCRVLRVPLVFHIQPTSRQLKMTSAQGAPSCARVQRETAGWFRWRGNEKNVTKGTQLKRRERSRRNGRFSSSAKRCGTIQDPLLISFINDSDNDHSFIQLSVHTALACPEGQSVCGRTIDDHLTSVKRERRRTRQRET